mmetsp:Transcript_28780/g.81189  ORF Transcript_28780/g.81189 Transcript_28780/m.81189 type:complete len:97 (-) Transcript_28780:310-600(-)
MALPWPPRERRRKEMHPTQQPLSAARTTTRRPRQWDLDKRRERSRLDNGAIRRCNAEDDFGLVDDEIMTMLRRSLAIVFLQQSNMRQYRGDSKRWT